MKSKKAIIIALCSIGVILLFILLGSAGKAGGVVYNDANELTGKTVAAISGAATGGMVERYYNSNVTLAYYNSNSDMAAALDSGKVDAYVADVYAGRLQCETYTDQKVLEDTPIQVNVAGFFYKKDDGKAAALCSDMNKLLAEFKESGKLEELEKKWSGKQKQVIDIPLNGEKGTLKYVCCSSIGKPFCFVQDDQIVGYEIEIAYLFCQRYGYDLEIIDSDYGGMLPSVATGKADFGGTCTSITEERKKQCLFSDPSLSIAFDLVVKSGAASAQSSLFDRIASSLNSTFVEEGRWRLFVEGILNTLLITVLSVLLGTILGLGVFFLCYDGKETVNTVVDFFMWLVHGMPVVVFLMVLYYCVFGNTSWSGTAISVIAFTIIFAFGFIAMLRNSYSAIDRGQTEAAIALGYTPFRALRKRILPQMVMYFRHAYKESIVSLLKATSIVGYIAVQDLTKVGDIIRGRTYDAFFPLIVVTILYFLIAAILTRIVECVFDSMDKRKRTAEQILKGVEQK